ncbi:MAG: hypothetical protein ACI8SE_001925 [Bacteroidia bacterium]|jgi:hypothetical protein
MTWGVVMNNQKIRIYIKSKAEYAQPQPFNNVAYKKRLPHLSILLALKLIYQGFAIKEGLFDDVEE